MSFECQSGEVEEESRWAKVTAKETTRAFLVSFFLQFFFHFRMKNKVPNVKRNHRRSGLDMLEFDEAWRSFNLYEA